MELSCPVRNTHSEYIVGLEKLVHFFPAINLAVLTLGIYRFGIIYMKLISAIDINVPSCL